MAENQEDRSTDDLTEDASPYRVEEYRRKGIVSQSKELSNLVGLVAVFSALYFYAPSILTQLLEFMREIFRMDMSSRKDLSDMTLIGRTMYRALGILAVVSLPVGLAGMVFGVISSFAQIGSIFSFDPIAMDLSKIDPMKGAKRMFSMRQLWEALRLILKIVATGTVAYYLIRAEIFTAPQTIIEDPVKIMASMSLTAKSIFISMICVLMVFAAADFFLQKQEFAKNLRMTKQEAKQEFKEREGDPQIKARIRSVQRELARRRMMQAVKKADVVITNPTHIAIAIVYDKDKMMAPKVVAKGADFVAQKIKMIAAASGVPQVENVPLARTLYKSVKVGQNVPRALYQAVAEILAYVYRLKSRKA